MKYLLIYDVKTSEEGKKRLRQVARACEDFGVRVQNSCFELELSGKDFIRLKAKIQGIIDDEDDNVRIYKLGDKTSNTISFGKAAAFEMLEDNGGFFL